MSLFTKLMCELDTMCESFENLDTVMQTILLPELCILTEEEFVFTFFTTQTYTYPLYLICINLAGASNVEYCDTGASSVRHFVLSYTSFKQYLSPNCYEENTAEEGLPMMCFKSVLYRNYKHSTLVIIWFHWQTWISFLSINLNKMFFPFFRHFELNLKPDARHFSKRFTLEVNEEETQFTPDFLYVGRLTGIYCTCFLVNDPQYPSLLHC